MDYIHEDQYAIPNPFGVAFTFLILSISMKNGEWVHFHKIDKKNYLYKVNRCTSTNGA
ncbi:hypothetical protein GCM10017717_33300 [Deinococcus persicinus]